MSRFGGGAFIASGLLFVVVAVLEYASGAPPSDGLQILAWISSHSLLQGLIPELIFFATVLLVPAVFALYGSLADRDPIKAATGCGIVAIVIAMLSVLLVIQGRLVYPVYGIRAHTPDIAELLVATYYGGRHAVALLMAIATAILSLAMLRGPYGRPVAYLGFATAALDIAGSYPDRIGPAPALVCNLCFALWFVAVGLRLYGMRPQQA